jgi:PAS domain S-box-containing protein
MKSTLHILHLEDDPRDAELVQERLAGDGTTCHVTRVETESDFIASLERGSFDLILADYTLPSFDGLSALKIARRNCPHVPFIFVSGTLDEEIAIEALKIGATDYVFKTRLSRIVPSVQRALREAEERIELVRSEAALRRSEAYLAEAQKLSHTGSFGWDVSSGKICWSPETFRIFEYAPAPKVTIEMVLQRTHPEDRSAALQLIERVSRERKAWDFEHRLLMPDGSIKHLRVMGHPSKDESGCFEFVGAITDITERKRTEEMLQQTDYYLTEGERLTHTGSYAWNATSGLVHVSGELKRIFGFDPDQPAPPHEAFRERVHPDDLAMFDALGERSMREGADLDWVYRIVLPGGTLKYLHVVARPVFSASGEVVGNIGTTRDVTERKRAEQDREKLRQAESDLAYISRVTTMGELTASLAHEIKQPMAAAVTNAHTCLRWLTPDRANEAEAREAASRVVKDVKRASEIINRIRLMFTKGASEREFVDLNEVIREMIVLLHNEAARYGISIRADLAADLPKVLADHVQMQQVFMNLMLNSIEAMKDVGSQGELVIKSQQLNDGELLISVSDTGVGLPPEIADRIFDAFFTTKPQGTGMGLPISRTIIESHGGRLWVAANSGRGATFQFTLPKEPVASSTSFS